MKKIFLSITIILSQLVSFSQEDIKNWVLYKSIDGIEIFTQEIDCYGENLPAQKAIILKVVNRTGDSYKVEWDLSIWYNYEKLVKNVSEGENHYTIELGPNNSTEGSCNVPHGALYIFKDFITYVSPTKLTNFTLDNIRITKI